MSQFAKETRTYIALDAAATAGDPINLTGAHSHMMQICAPIGFAGPVTLTIEQTGISPEDHCAPDESGWTDMGEVKDCESGKEFVAWEMVLQGTDPDAEDTYIEPGTCCHVMLRPCNAPYIRLVADAAGLSITLLEHNLKRSL